MMDNYIKRMSLKGSKMGEALKKQSDMIMINTWDRDIQSKDCLIYDYWHDTDFFPEAEKTPVKIKFVKVGKNSTGKDQVDYHVQFMPGYTCPFDLVKDYSKDKYYYPNEFPIGLYLDIPFDEGVEKWIIVFGSHDLQFRSYIVLPCNYKFTWVKDSKKYRMWGCSRSRNSYNSGIWTDYKTTTVENQNQIWLPTNEFSNKLYYDDRLIIGAYREKPITWKVTKVEDLYPMGINKLTMGQTKFDPDTDYIDYDTHEMWASYYNTTLQPDDSLDKNEYIGELNVGDRKIKIGYAKVITIDAPDYEIDYTNLVWEFSINKTYTEESQWLKRIYMDDANKLKIKTINDFDLSGAIMDINVTDGNRLLASVQLEVQ